MFTRVCARPISSFQARSFSLSIARHVKAIVYSRNGEPTDVLSVRTLPELPAPTGDQVKLRFSLSPVNPADLNVIQGAYPSKPKPREDLGTSEPTFVAGNEGLAVVEEVGDAVSAFSKGDWVIFSTPQFGTWTSETLAKQSDIICVPRSTNSILTEVQAATLTVNPPTALALLTRFVDLEPGEFVIQNGGNSSVGQAVIQIAHQRGLKTINLVRDREQIEQLREQLRSLGADYVMTYNELGEQSARNTVREWTEGKPIRLGLNCVGGKDTTLMARFLGQDAHLVSYGAMSKAPLSLPTSLFIFKNLTCHGYWQSRWYLQHSAEERQQLIEELVQMMESGIVCDASRCFVKD
ncbi:NADP-binding protein [Dacryopinax primogenitus]|uniref:enoyl-[acyl-carrier-protein] reductase n=1 Tax=Dacryopinax primogenitus (strain DJM 731) TaxID=1858805 RepID=M5G0M4_DACPD|nr:NADP-binding protein [Dacryopinax primogenitus]EJU03801.1 NADP-binding protein [Dacryopinax primogenitus]